MVFKDLMYNNLCDLVIIFFLIILWWERVKIDIKIFVKILVLRSLYFYKFGINSDILWEVVKEIEMILNLV